MDRPGTMTDLAQGPTWHTLAFSLKNIMKHFYSQKHESLKRFYTLTMNGNLAHFPGSIQKKKKLLPKNL